MKIAFFALEVSAHCLLLLHLSPKLLIEVVMVIFVYLFHWIFLILFLMPVLMLVQVFSSIPLPIFFRASNYRASVLQKWLNSSHYKSRVRFNPDLVLVKCIESSSVLFVLLISAGLFCTSNDRPHTINSQLSRGSLSAWWIPWTDTCTGLVWRPSLCLDLFSHSNHAKS